LNEVSFDALSFHARSTSLDEKVVADKLLGAAGGGTVTCGPLVGVVQVVLNGIAPASGNQSVRLPGCTARPMAGLPAFNSKFRAAIFLKPTAAGSDSVTPLVPGSEI
jgi:hypothetical protein